MDETLETVELRERIREAREKIWAAGQTLNELIRKDPQRSAAYKVLDDKLGKAETLMTLSLLRIEEMKAERVGETPLETLGLTVRTFNCLGRAGVKSVEELLNMTQKELIRIRGMGSRSYNEIVSTLEEKGMSLKRY